MAYRVLIVDDEPILTRLLGKMLSLDGYVTELVNDSTQVLERLRQFQPDAVILDIAMPIVDGYKIAQGIRVEPGFANVLIVALSGYGDSQARKSLVQGIDHHLVKPVDFEELREILSREIDLDRRRALSRLAEIKARIECMLELPANRELAEYADLIQERARLHKQLGLA